jgi:hypothetical protein
MDAIHGYPDSLFRAIVPSAPAPTEGKRLRLSEHKDRSTEAIDRPVAKLRSTVSAAVGTVGGIITWLAGSVAGIGAILYALGALVTLANLHMLGLPAIDFHHPSEFYIEEGGLFLALTLIQPLQQVSPLGLAMVAAAAIVVGLLYIPLARAARWAEARSEKFGTARRFCRHNWRFAAVGALAVVLALHIESTLHFPEVLSVKDMLFNASAHGEGGMRALAAIRDGDHIYRQTAYGWAVVEFEVMAGLFCGAWLCTINTVWGWLPRAVFLSSFVLSFVWLPLEYGKLILNQDFPRLRLTLEPGAGVAGPIPGDLFLLDRTDTDLVGWNADTHEVIWVPNRNIARLDVTQAVSLSEVITKSRTLPNVSH